MCHELKEELATGKRLARELVEHMTRMGGAAEVVIPVEKVDDRGRLCQWEVTVKLGGVIDAPVMCGAGSVVKMSRVDDPNTFDTEESEHG